MVIISIIFYLLDMFTEKPVWDSISGLITPVLVTVFDFVCQIRLKSQRLK